MNTRHGCPCADRAVDCDGNCECGQHYIRNENDKLVLQENSKAIYECNINCLCPPTCNNRLLQHGCDRPLRASFLDDMRGHGLFAEQRIQKGEFVIEYIGEVITQSEAHERLKQTREEKSMNYILSVRESFAIDDTHSNVHIDAKTKDAVF